MSLPIDETVPDPFPELSRDCYKMPSPWDFFNPSQLCNRSCGSMSSDNIYGSTSHRGAGAGACMHGSPSSSSIPYTKLHNPRDDRAYYNTINNKRMSIEVDCGDNKQQTIVVDHTMTARDVVSIIIKALAMGEDKNWTLTEHVKKQDIERCLEDHEIVADVYCSWPEGSGNKFTFSKDYRKYDVFYNPIQFLPVSMLAFNEKDPSSPLGSDDVSSSDPLGTLGSLGSVGHQQVLSVCLRSKDTTLPNVHGYLYTNGPKKSWKRYFCVLKPDGIHYCKKGKAIEYHNLEKLVDIHKVDVYRAHSAKKSVSAPNNFAFCLKTSANVTGMCSRVWFCAENEQSRMCWITAIRLVKYGRQLKENFQLAKARDEASGRKSPESSPAERFLARGRVAMDFSGASGRVLEDPKDVMGVAIEESQHWRNKQIVRGSICSSPSTTPPKAPTSSMYLGEGGHTYAEEIHVTQPWYHASISRQEAEMLIERHGLVDGIFLIRESRSLPGTFVLSLAAKQRVNHCQIHKVHEDDRTYFSLDRETKFQDLIQLVEFYQINTSALQTRLIYPVTTSR